MASAAPYCIAEWCWHGKCPRLHRIYCILHVVDKYPSAIWEARSGAYGKSVTFNHRRVCAISSPTLPNASIDRF